MSRQHGADCGLWVCNYVEVEVRRFHGQIMPVPFAERIKWVRRMVESVGKCLERTREAWLTQRRENTISRRLRMRLMAERAAAVLKARNLN